MQLGIKIPIWTLSPRMALLPFLTPFLNPMTCYANFFQWLNPDILVMKSIISDPSKNSFTKEKLSLGHFWFNPFCTISPKEYQCSDGYQCILDPLITKIIHVLAFLRPKVAAQLHFWWFFKASLVHRANFSQKDWKTNFRSSISNHPKTFSFSEVLTKLLDRLSLEGQR